MTGVVPESDSTVLRTLALAAGLAVLAGPRRTRPLAGFLYGVALSRVHGAARHRLSDHALQAARRGGVSHARHEARLDELEQSPVEITIDGKVIARAVARADKEPSR